MGARLRELRALAEVSCSESDRLAGVCRGMTSYAELSGADISSSRSAAYARVFGVSLDWLVSGEGPRPSKGVVQRAVQRARERLRRSAA